jgi:hypothetical protein
MSYLSVPRLTCTRFFVYLAVALVVPVAMQVRASAQDSLAHGDRAVALPADVAAEMGPALNDLYKCLGDAPTGEDVIIRENGTLNERSRYGSTLAGGRELKDQVTLHTIERGLHFRAVELQTAPPVARSSVHDEVTIVHPLLGVIFRGVRQAGNQLFKQVVRHVQCGAPLFPLQVGGQYSLTLVTDTTYYPSDAASPTGVASSATSTSQLTFRVLQAYDAGSITAEAPWLKVHGHDSSHWQFLKVMKTETTTYKWTAGPYLGSPIEPTSVAQTLFYVSGPEVSFEDLSAGTDNYSTEITEIGFSPGQQAAPVQAAVAGGGNPRELSQEERNHYDATFKTGRPSQMYLLALDMDQSGHSDLATRLLKAIVDRFPDDPYAAKAIDRLEAKQGGKK